MSDIQCCICGAVFQALDSGNPKEDGLFKNYYNPVDDKVYMEHGTFVNKGE